MSLPPTRYRGRFAPTASGPLHLGSLLTALAGFLDARHVGGEWRLRIDDLDAPRCRPEYADTIQDQLRAHGLRWDGAVRYQSHHLETYKNALVRLQDQGLLYACICTRRQLAETSRAGPDGPVYAGTCRDQGHSLIASTSWRLRLDDGDPLEIVDPWQGLLRRNRRRDVGDFIVRRSDAQIGYQLACVVDDRDCGMTHVVRGADLIGSSLRQLRVFEALAATPPRFAHLPVLTGDDGRKLSKQNHATPIDSRTAIDNLRHCLHLLRQSPQASAQTVPELLDRAIAAWCPQAVPGRSEMSASMPLDGPQEPLLAS